MAGSKRDALDAGGERVANTDDGHVAMRLLPAAWRQKWAAAALLRRKGAVTKQPQGCVSLPGQANSSRVCSFQGLPFCCESVKR